LPIASPTPTGDESRSDEGSEIRGEPDETRRRKDEEKGERRIHLQERKGRRVYGNLQNRGEGDYRRIISAALTNRLRKER